MVLHLDGNAQFPQSIHETCCTPCEWYSNDAQGVGIPIRLKILVGMEVISNPFPICLSWLLIANNRIYADVLHDMQSWISSD